MSNIDEVMDIVDDVMVVVDDIVDNIADIVAENDIVDDIVDVPKSIIKHLVISGGGIAGFSFYGAVREFQKQGIWDIHNIKTIYGTSIGAMFAFILALKYDWETLDDYIIKRPWQNVYKFNMQNVIFTFQTKGIFDIKVVEDTFLPLFKAKEMSIDITMKEFFEVTGIDVHVFTVDINLFELVEISHTTHPDWRVVDAVYCSCSLPIVFKPLIRDGKCYTDGGFFVNYPVQQCIQNGADPDEILGICRKPITKSNVVVEEKSSLFDYILNIFYKTTEKVLNSQSSHQIHRELFVDSPPLSLYDIFSTTSSMDERLRLIEIGVQAAQSL